MPKYSGQRWYPSTAERYQQDIIFKKAWRMMLEGVSLPEVGMYCANAYKELFIQYNEKEARKCGLI